VTAPTDRRAVDVQETAEEDGEDERDDVADLAHTEEHGPQTEGGAFPVDPTP
jgi:hypothetical protein